MKVDDLITTLEEAVSFDDTTVVVRAAGAIAEVLGPLSVRNGKEWLALGDEGRSHVHLKKTAVDRVSFVSPADRNSAVELLDAEGTIVCRVAFRRTNPSRDNFDQDRRERITARFHHLERREES